MPKRCIAAAAKGPVMPIQENAGAAAKLITARDQPKSVPQGTISTAGRGAQTRSRQQREKNQRHHQ